MSILPKDQIKQMMKHYDVKTTGDIKATFKDMFGEAIQEIMEAKLDTHLGYDKNSKETKNTNNRHNGTSSKTLQSSEFLGIPLTIPRDRNSEYEPIIVKKNQTSLSGLEDQIIAMYTKGLSTREIQDYFTVLYGAEVSSTLISNVTNKILPLVKAWQNRPLDVLCPIIFMDTIHSKVRHE